VVEETGYENVTEVEEVVGHWSPIELGTTVLSCYLIIVSYISITSCQDAPNSFTTDSLVQTYTQFKSQEYKYALIDILFDLAAVSSLHIDNSHASTIVYQCIMTYRRAALLASANLGPVLVKNALANCRDVSCEYS